jgi:hypothetical protein
LGEHGFNLDPKTGEMEVTLAYAEAWAIAMQISAPAISAISGQ